MSSRSNSIGSPLLKIGLGLDGRSTWTAATVDTNGSLSLGSDASLLAPGDAVDAVRIGDGFVTTALLVHVRVASASVGPDTAVNQ